MIKLEIKDVTYSIPTDWSEVTLKQFQQLAKVGKGNSPYRIMMDRFKILVTPEVPQELLEQFDIRSFQDVIEKMSFITTYPDKEDVRVVEVGGKKYGVIKSLENNISVGEWADIEFFIGKSEESLIEQYDKVLGVIVRPLISDGEDNYEIEKYDSTSLDSRSKLFLEQMKADDAMALIGFFLRLEIEFITNTMNSSMETEKMKKLKTLPMVEAFMSKTGDGLDTSMN